MPAAGMTSASAPTRTGAGGAVSLVIAGAFAQQFGAALAVTLFPRAGAGGVVFLRLVVSAIVLLALFRPRVRRIARADWAVVAGFGVALAAMNIFIYQAIARIPLGAAVTFEMLGPLVLAVVTSRRALSWLAAALALGGVLLMSGGGFDALDPVGVAFALGAAAMWAAYILLSASTGRRFPRNEGLALAMAIGALLAAPLGVLSAGTRLLDPVTIGLGAVVAVLSSAIPYALELRALRTIAPATFAILMSLMPAIATIAGVVALDQRVTVVAASGMALVIVASALAVAVGRPVAARRAAAEAGPP